jgi:hypothetical protein
MKFVKVLLPLAAAALIMGTASARDYDGFYGNGDWVIGGKTFKADQRTNIDHGRDQKIGVGSCVKVEGGIDREGNFFVSEIEQKRDNRCR